MSALHAIAIALLALPGIVAAQTTSEALRGEWQTPLAEQAAPSGGASAYVREVLIFGEAANTVLIEAFADPDGTVPLFTYASEGPYDLPGPSAAVPGALILDARNETATVTIHREVPEIWRALNLGDCSLRIDVAVDLADCVSGPPFNSATCVELDLVGIVDGQLYLGARDVDRCTTRPTSLGETAYERR